MNLTSFRSAVTSAITGTLTDVSMTGYLLSPVEPPCFEIDFPDETFLLTRTAGGKTTEFSFVLRGYVQFGDPQDGQIKLDGWLSDGSSNVEALLKSDRTLNGAVDELYVRSISAPLRIQVDNTIYLCAEWTVDVIVSNS